MTTNKIGYMGFESPMNQYAPAATIPVLYTGSAQIRQFGAGDCLTMGTIGKSSCYGNILGALYAPTTGMQTAATQSLTYGLTQPPYVVTKNDIDQYQVAGTVNA